MLQYKVHFSNPDSHYEEVIFDNFDSAFKYFEECLHAEYYLDKILEHVHLVIV